jgi:hypothetical protein
MDFVPTVHLGDRAPSADTEEDPYRFALRKPGDFRLLHLLLHEEENEPLKCELLTYSFEVPENMPPSYTALSYVWGERKKTVPISVNETYFMVTENLHAALQNFKDRSVEWL